MPNVSCQKCKKDFYAKPSHQKLGWGKFCSIACRSEGNKKGQDIICATCGKTAWKMPRDFARSKSGNHFCSKSCQTVWRNKQYSGKNHPLWQGGEYCYREKLIRSGQKSICKRCGLEDERVLEAHHIDKDRKNSEMENLVWLCRNCHCLVHNHNEKF